MTGGLTVLVSLLAASSILVVGCGSSEGDGRGSNTIGGQTGRGDSDTPSGDDLEAVEPLIEDLLGDYDDIVNEAVGDPAVAEEADATLVRQLTDLFEDDAPTVEDLLHIWQERSSEGLVTQPFDEAEPISRSRLDGDVETVSDDEVRFPYCVERRFVVYDDGELTQRVPYQEQRGEGVAVRAGGEWRLRELVTEQSATCRTGSQVQTGGTESTGTSQGSTTSQSTTTSEGSQG